MAITPSKAFPARVARGVCRNTLKQHPAEGGHLEWCGFCFNCEETRELNSVWKSASQSALVETALQKEKQHLHSCWTGCDLPEPDIGFDYRCSATQLSNTGTPGSSIRCIGGEILSEREGSSATTASIH